MTKEIILETKNVRREFGALVAVADVSIQVQARTLHSIIGPNGAGKTTFFNVLSGNLAATSGRVFFKGRDIPACRCIKRRIWGSAVPSRSPISFPT